MEDRSQWLFGIEDSHDKTQSQSSHKEGKPKPQGHEIIIFLLNPLIVILVALCVLPCWKDIEMDFAFKKVIRRTLSIFRWILQK